MTGLKKILIIFTVAIVMASICNTYRVAAYEPTLKEISEKVKELYPVMNTSYSSNNVTIKIVDTEVTYLQVKRVLFAENLKTNQELATASAIINAVADLQGLSTSQREEASNKFANVESLKNLTYTVDKNGVEITEDENGAFTIKINMDKYFTETPEEDTKNGNIVDNNTNISNTATNIVNTVTNTNTSKTNTSTNKNNTTTTSGSNTNTANVVNTPDDTYANKAIPKTGSNFVAKRVCLGILFASTATLVFIIMYNKKVGMSDGTK